MKEIRRILPEDLQHLCIRKDWYTKGTNEDYSKLMDKCMEKNGDYRKLSLKDIYWMGYDIFIHSDMSGIGIPDKNCIDYACSEVLNECHLQIDTE